MAAKSFEASLPNFLDLKERLQEAPFRSLENEGVIRKLVAYSWNSSKKTTAILKSESVKKRLIKL